MTKRRNPLDRYALDIAPGELTWIGVRPKRREPLQSVSATKAVATLGLEGDHRVPVGRCPSFRKSLLHRRRISLGVMASTPDCFDAIW